MSIFVGGIPYSMSKREFEELARQKVGGEHFQSGGVTDVNLLMEGPGSDRNKGFGFIKTSDIDIANTIVERANSGVSSQTWAVDGATLQLRMAKGGVKDGQPQHPRGPPPSRFDQESMFGRGGGGNYDQGGRGRGMMGGRGAMRGRGGDNFQPRGRGGGDFNTNRYPNTGTQNNSAEGGSGPGEDPYAGVNLPLALSWAHYKVVLVANCGTQLPESLTKEEESSCILETAETAQHTFVVMRKNVLEVRASAAGAVDKANPRGRGRGRGFLPSGAEGGKDEEWDRVKGKLEAVGFKPTHAPSLKRMRDAAGDCESRAATKEEILQTMLELGKQNGKFVAIAEPRKESATTVVLVPRTAVSFQSF